MGMRTFDDVLGGTHHLRKWYELVPTFKPKSGIWHHTRLLGGVLPILGHWVSTGAKGFTLYCPAFDPETEVVQRPGCPACRAGLKGSLQYLINVIDRSDGQIKVWACPKTAATAIQKLRALNGGVSVADLANGRDIAIQLDKSDGSFGRYTVQLMDKTPLAAMPAIHDLDQIYQPNDASDIERALRRVGVTV